MPELPEVETVRANTEMTCSGRTVLSVKVIDDAVVEGCSAKELASFCGNRTVIGARRHGKQMFIELDRGGFVTVHLGMTGDLVFKAKKGKPGKHDRVLFNFKDGSQLVYEDMRKFGVVGIAASIDQFVKMKRLGPDALEVGKKEFVFQVCRHKRAIKTVLLDQNVLAGIGNLYADEVLFQSRIHPLRLASALSSKEAEALFKNTRKVLKASMRVSSDFELLPTGFMLAVRGPGASCPRGNGRMASLKVNGRTTFYCPNCQRI
jgi:formamidopyrimidine-DNA glycosylase